MPATKNGASELIKLDMNSGVQSPIPDAVGGGLIAIDSHGAIFSLCCGRLTDEGIPLIGVSRLDYATNQWEVADVQGGFTIPYDMEIKPDGILIVSTEDGMLELDREVHEIPPSSWSEHPGARLWVGRHRFDGGGHLHRDPQRGYRLVPVPRGSR